MHVPINSFKFFGMELDIYKHKQNPSEQTSLEDYYLDGYLEIFLLFTEEHPLINTGEYRVLIVSPTDGRTLFMKEGNLFVLTIGPFEQFVGIRHTINHEYATEGTVGADFFNLLTQPLKKKERCETLVVRHTKGILIPESMLLN